MPNHPHHPPYHLMAKPTGSACNLECKYCFYLEKKHLYPGQEIFRMSRETLEVYIREYIQSQDTAEVTFGWQGGEPTLMGLDFFTLAVQLQQQYAGGKTISNAIQTNGILLNDQWGEFLAKHQFLVGYSIDGPPEFHDRFRITKSGQPTFVQVMQGLDILKKYQIEFNTLTCIHRYNATHPREIYRFLKQIGSAYMQFIPLVERGPDTLSLELGLDYATPPQNYPGETNLHVTDWTVPAKSFGEFMIGIFDEWIEQDVGTVFVQYFDVALANWMKLGSPLCIFAKTCGRALIIEHDGSIYSCDHYVYPDYKLGKLGVQSLESMVYSEPQRQFGEAKFNSLPETCLQCEFLFACYGGCPKHRFIQSPGGQPGLNYLCEGYKLFFEYIDPYMQVMQQLLQSGQPASRIMKIIKEYDKQQLPQKPGPNSPCPCESGKKYKQCCGKTLR